MKSAAILPTLALALAGAVVAPASFAQTAAAPLSYVQPLSPQSVQAVQDRLRQAGAYSGNVDGIWGADSETALQHFQQTHQLQVTGQMNQATAATLGIDPGTLLAAAQPAPTAAPQPAGETLRPQSIRAIQTRLRALNFYSGAVDGVWGESTQAAIERFQQGRGLQPNGQLNPATISAMGLPPDVLTYR
jgi:peptidoglycan hydrolase-like protein with peptidoglycan-binding domain